MPIVAALALALAAGAGAARADDTSKPAPPPPPAGGEVSAAEADELLAFLDKLVAAIPENQKDCAKVAAPMHTVIDAHQELVRRAVEYREAKKDLPKAHKEAMQKKGMAMLTKLGACMQDDRLQAVFKRLDSAPPRKKDTKAPPKK